jgi:hypothetical protein
VLDHELEVLEGLMYGPFFTCLPMIVDDSGGFSTTDRP